MNCNEIILVKRNYNPSTKDFLVHLCNNPHPNLPNIVEINDNTYIMEYIQGETLQIFLDKNQLTENEASRLMLQLIDAVDYLHNYGIVHRDINPNNIIIDTEGNLILIDFDIARKITIDKEKDTHLLGTVGYAAPEQFGFSQTDERTDIYALGIVYNYMLHDEVANKELQKIITKCTHIDKTKRYKNVKALRKDVKLKHFTTYKLLDIIPGFRSGSLWKMIFACTWYIAFFLGYITMFVTQLPTIPPEDTLGFIAVFIVFLFYIFLFFAIATNFLNIANKIKIPFKKRWKNQVLALVLMYIFASIVAFAIEQKPEAILTSNPISATILLYLYIVYSIISSFFFGML